MIIFLFLSFDKKENILWHKYFSLEFAFIHFVYVIDLSYLNVLWLDALTRKVNLKSIEYSKLVTIIYFSLITNAYNTRRKLVFYIIAISHSEMEWSIYANATMMYSKKSCTARLHYIWTLFPNVPFSKMFFELLYSNKFVLNPFFCILSIGNHSFRNFLLTQYPEGNIFKNILHVYNWNFKCLNQLYCLKE